MGKFEPTQRNLTQPNLTTKDVLTFRHLKTEKAIQLKSGENVVLDTKQSSQPYEKNVRFAKFKGGGGGIT